jgi:NADP-dependent 3-hydroxy acid dehydrogenase YdfG
MRESLVGKIALVTGSSSGIGEAAALALAAEGAIVAVCARRSDRLAALVQRIETAGAKALALPCDMTQESEAIKAVGDTVSKFGRIDILINSAGVMQTGGIEGCDTDQYRQVFDINLFATLYACNAAIPHMLEQQCGDIINISSLAARKGKPHTSAYSASKHALNSMTDLMRQEVGDRNIRVCTLMPGATTTEVGDRITDPKWRHAIQDHVNKPGAVLPSDTADAIVFILSLPRRVNISEICVRPTIDTTP